MLQRTQTNVNLMNSVVAVGVVVVVAAAVVAGGYEGTI